MTVTTIFDPPLPGDSLPVFNAKSFDTVSKYNAFATELNSTAADVNADAASALASKNAAATSETNASAFASAAAGNAAAAATSAGAAVWVSGSYSTGQAARSPSNQRVYIARTTGSKPTDPASDPTNWKQAAAGALPDVPYAGTTATASLNERSRFTNSAAVAVTVPVPTAAGDYWSCLFENGRYDNSFNIGAATLRHNGVSHTGVITNNLRLAPDLVSVGANEWRFA